MIFFAGHYEIAEDALEIEKSIVHEEDEVSSHTNETHQLTPVVDLTEQPFSPVLFQAPIAPKTYKNQPHPSPTKADKILALISEIGANQVKCMLTLYFGRSGASDKVFKVLRLLPNR